MNMCAGHYFLIFMGVLAVVTFTVSTLILYWLDHGNILRYSIGKVMEKRSWKKIHSKKCPDWADSKLYFESMIPGGE